MLSDGAYNDLKWGNCKVLRKLAAEGKVRHSGESKPVLSTSHYYAPIEQLSFAVGTLSEVMASSDHVLASVEPSNIQQAISELRSLQQSVRVIAKDIARSVEKSYPLLEGLDKRLREFERSERAKREQTSRDAEGKS